MQQEIHNWGRDIYSYPTVVVTPVSVDEIQAIMRDQARYPAPVRAAGSNHSTTGCATADGGTLVVMTRLNSILDIGPETVTAQAGALYIDVALALEKQGRQLFVNVELGNLTLGSACTGGTKDASMPGELGQVCSYAIHIKMVAPGGELIEFDEDDSDALQLARSSYGLFGIVYEVTFRTRKLQPMAVHHENYELEEFIDRLPQLTQGSESMMLYLFPHEGKVTVEYRSYGGDGTTSRRWVWQIRNWVWKNFAPLFGWFVSKYVPWNALRFWMVDTFNGLTRWFQAAFLHGDRTSAAAQIIRYPERSGRSAYTFSIWAFPEEAYPEILRGYYRFCRDYYRKYGWRCDMLNVGYRIAEDRGSLLSYSFSGNVLTLDPVASGAHGWDEFLRAYNEYCSQNGGVPLFNQTKWITRKHVREAFDARLDRFAEAVRKYDPGQRLLNGYFRERIFGD